MFAPKLATRVAPKLRQSFRGVLEERTQSSLLLALGGGGGGRIASCLMTSPNLDDGSRRHLSVSTSRPRMLTRQFVTEQKTKKKTAKMRYEENRTVTGLGQVIPPEEATSIVLRHACVTDCAGLLRYLRAQAEWEGNRNEVEISEEDLIRDGFEGHPLYKCAIAEAHGEDHVTSMIGYAMYNVGFCAWKGKTLIWENMFLHPLYRDFGIGTMFLHEICKEQYDNGCRQVCGLVDDHEVQLKRWYTSLGFEDHTALHGFHFYAFSGDALTKYIQHAHRGMEYEEKAKTSRIQPRSFINKP